MKVVGIDLMNLFRNFKFEKISRYPHQLYMAIAGEQTEHPAARYSTYPPDNTTGIKVQAGA